MISGVILCARKIAAPIVFRVWMTIAVPEIPDPALAGSTSPELTDEALARLMEDCAGRMIDIWLPRNLERRLKAHIHRMNAGVLCAGYAEGEQFDTANDIDSALVTAALIGMRAMEFEDGVQYSERTGFPVGDLSEGD